MPLDNFTYVLRTHVKEVLAVVFSYSLIKKNDVITAYGIWISGERRIYSNIGPYLARNTTGMVLDQTITIYYSNSVDI